MINIAIIGAGLSGLTAAWEILQLRPECRVTVFEAGAKVGGKICTELEEGFLYEHGPNGWLASRQSIGSLVERVGLGGEVMQADEAAANRYLWRENRLLKLPTKPQQILGWEGLSWKARLRLAGDFFQRPRLEEDESVHDFASKQFGKEFADAVFDPFCTGVFGADSRKLSMRSCFPPVFAWQRRYGSVTRGAIASRPKDGPPKKKGPGLHSLKRGMGSLIEALAGQIRAPSRIVLNQAVSGLRLLGRKVHVDAGSESGVFDGLILACPADAVSSILGELLPPDLRQQNHAIAYTSMGVAVCGFRSSGEPLLPPSFGFLVPSSEPAQILGCLLDSRVFPGRCEAGHEVLRMMFGGPRSPGLLNLGDDELKAVLLPELRRTLQLGRDPDFVKIIRWPRAIPSPAPFHFRLVDGLEKALAGTPILLAGNAYHGVSMDDCARAGKEAAAGILARLEQ
ncbi:MAG: protoporphyrinogen oxidase [Verrucomicrobiota bacterium]|jgi:oxygen-dependent protoporphyrinogen oxidase